MKDSIKKQKLLHSLIKRGDWELETARADLAVAKDVLEKASSELDQTKNVLKDLDSQLRESMQNGTNIDFAIMNMTKQFMSSKKDEEKLRREIFRKAKKVTDQVLTRLSEKMAEKKGYERVFAKQNESINKEVIKKEGREIEDNWLSQHGVNHD